MLAWDTLSELDAYRITEIPRRPEPGVTQPPPADSDDQGRTQRLAALVAAYHAATRAASRWVRPGSSESDGDGAGPGSGRRGISAIR